MAYPAHAFLEDVELGETSSIDTEATSPIRHSLDASYRHRYRAYMRAGGRPNIVVLGFHKLCLDRIARLQDEILELQCRYIHSGLGGESVYNKLDPQSRVVLDEKLDSYTSAIQNYRILTENSSREIPQGGTLQGILSSCGFGDADWSIDGLRWRLIYDRHASVHPFRGFANLLSHFWPAPRSTFTDGVRTDFKKLLSVQFFEVNRTANSVDRAEMSISESVKSLYEALGFIKLESHRPADVTLQDHIERVVMNWSFSICLILLPMGFIVMSADLTIPILIIIISTMAFPVVAILLDEQIQGKDLLAATAAYTAVLCALVGVKHSW